MYTIQHTFICIDDWPFDDEKQTEIEVEKKKMLQWYNFKMEFYIKATQYT